MLTVFCEPEPSTLQLRFARILVWSRFEYAGARVDVETCSCDALNSTSISSMHDS